MNIGFGLDNKLISLFLHRGNISSSRVDLHFNLKKENPHLLTPKGEEAGTLLTREEGEFTFASINKTFTDLAFDQTEFTDLVHGS